MNKIRKVFLLLLLLFGFLVTTEIGLRIFRPKSLQYYRDIKLLHRYHPDYLVGLSANEDRHIEHFENLWKGRFTTNSLGFRGSPEPDPNKPKIGCLGDSLVMGFGASDEETFCNQLNGMNLGDGPIQAMNLGVDAYGSLGAALRMKDSLEKVHLDSVLFFVSPNDFTLPEELRKRGIQPDDVTDAVRFKDEEYKNKFHLQFELTRYSYLLQILKLAASQLQLKAILTAKSIQTESKEAGIGTSEHILDIPKTLQYTTSSFYRFPKKNRCEKDSIPVASERIQTETCKSPPPSYHCTSNKPDPSVLEPLPDITKAAYDKMISVAADHHTKLILVLLPVQIEDLYCSSVGLYSPLYAYALRAADYFRKKGQTVLELQNYTIGICGWKEWRGKRQFFQIEDYIIPGDGHLTPIGNHWVSESLKVELHKQRENNAL